MTELGCLGMLVLAGGSYASLRDLADYGATLGFDDAEGVMNTRRTDPDKRALFLAGNRRGSSVTLKASGRHQSTRRVNTFCPRLFSAINLPDPTLGSRTIIIPMVRSSDETKANLDPINHDIWPEDRRVLVDDLWMTGLAHLTTVKAYDRKVADRVTLTGRTFEPWRAILAVALWLQERHGVEGLFDRMNEMAVRYQSDRVEIEEPSLTHVAIAALQRIFLTSNDSVIEVSPGALAAAMHAFALEEGIDYVGKTYTSDRKVGRLLKRMGIKRAQRTGAGKRWEVTRTNLEQLAKTYRMPAVDPKPALNAVTAVHAVVGRPSFIEQKVAVSQ